MAPHPKHRLFRSLSQVKSIESSQRRRAPYAVELYPACGRLRRRCSELSVYGCSLLLPCISLVAVSLWRKSSLVAVSLWRKSSLHLLTLGSLVSSKPLWSSYPGGLNPRALAARLCALTRQALRRWFDWNDGTRLAVARKWHATHVSWLLRFCRGPNDTGVWVPLSPRSFWLFLVFGVFLGTENVFPGPYISALNLYTPTWDIQEPSLVWKLEWT